MRNLKPSGTTKVERTVSIFTCSDCHVPYEVEGFQSNRVCPYCRPAKKCKHGILTTAKCEPCKKVTGSYFIRQF